MGFASAIRGDGHVAGRFSTTSAAFVHLVQDHRASGPASGMRQDEAMTIASAPYTLILLRHGESEWNAKNLFTAGSC